MNFLKKNLYKLFLISFLILVPVISFAVEGGNEGCDPTEGKICNPIPSVTSVDGLVKKFLEGALKIGSPVVALAVIYCGFLFVEARGNPEKITKAKEALLYTLIGAGILLGSWAIAKLIASTVTELGIINISLGYLA